jgi:GNAT acetyltransferase-like protein
MELVVGELVLRPPRETDLAAVVAACQDPDISRFIPLVPAPYTDEDGRAWLAAVEQAWHDSDERTFAIVDKTSAALLGAVTIRLSEGGAVGYWLSRPARGRGVMTEAVKAVSPGQGQSMESTGSFSHRILTTSPRSGSPREQASSASALPSMNRRTATGRLQPSCSSSADPAGASACLSSCRSAPSGRSTDTSSSTPLRR